MEKIITVFFDSEEHAFKASQTINQLAADGDISINEFYVLSKNETGEVTLKNAKNEVTSYATSGAFAGGFLGLLGGPLGVLFGVTTGLFAGGIGDLIRSSKSSRFLEKASESIPVGKTAIVANINEYWETPLNTVIQPYNVEIKRLNVNEEVEKFIIRQQRELNEEIQEISSKLEKATEEEKEKLNARLSTLKTQRNELKEEVKKNAVEQKGKIATWFGNMKTKFSNWKDDVADQFDEEKEDLIDDYEDIKEDYQELSKKIKTSLSLLNYGTEESFKKSVDHIRKKISELDEDISGLEKEINKLSANSKERWQTRLTGLKEKRNNLIAKAKLEFEKHKEKLQSWIDETEGELKNY
ncbi:DUF1269 domain-containing protein [Olivibacter sp. XZL3]|uniref:DUF1269 domain-containing protein n=1 Tax=Olivibacter sp. XZL3 TaxID=1735116 RepID=UPI001066F4F2|nr:DUF1269 domain-containing protein [Olivibacter sp. XZL3]